MILKTMIYNNSTTSISFQWCGLPLALILSSDEQDNRPDQGTEELRLNKKLQQLHQRTSDFV
jgi:hypothetical protein